MTRILKRIEPKQTPDRIIAYLGEAGQLTDWHGKPLGRYKITSTWRIKSWISNRMHQVIATVDGVQYTGRSGGVGLAFNGKRKAP